MTLAVKHISLFINRTPDDVYEFASNAANLPRWAQGLSKTEMIRSGDEWIADSPMGKVRVQFAERNKFGVMDHHVTLPTGEVVHNPLRVVPNSTGSEITFTLFRQPTMSESDFEKDARMVESDLLRLKELLDR